MRPPQLRLRACIHSTDFGSCGSRRRLYAAAATAASCMHSHHGFRFLRLAPQALCDRHYRGFVHAFTSRLALSCGSRRRLYAIAATAASCMHSLHGFRFLRLAPQALCSRRFRGFVHAFTSRLSVPAARALSVTRKSQRTAKARGERDRHIPGTPGAGRKSSNLHSPACRAGYQPTAPGFISQQAKGQRPGVGG